MEEEEIMVSQHNHQNKIAVINDMSGFGRCSLAVALPIISTLKVQCCPVPTSILSNHTGFPSYFFDDYTDRLVPYMEEWKKLQLTFSGICTGFLGSKEQIQMVLKFFQDFSTEDTIIIIDPVMGDYGKTYSTYTTEMCNEMKKLVKHATILTPNLTEACILTDTPYHENKWRQKDIAELAMKLSEMGPQKVVITGIPQGEFISNYSYEKEKEGRFQRTQKVGTQRSGTGDIFASIIAADAVNGVEFDVSVKKASRFIKKCILKSLEMDIPITDGVCFEEVLHLLK